MLDFILKLLIPDYFDYKEEMEKQMKTLERELKENEKYSRAITIIRNDETRFW